MTKSTIRDQIKDKQIFNGMVYSEDLLIRSLNEAQQNVVPYLSQMFPLVECFELEDLAELSTYNFKR